MATSKTEAPSVSKSGKLENMTHDDLVKTNKKQLIFLQKLKAKCDDLQSKLSEQTDYVQIKAKLTQIEEENVNLSNHVKLYKEQETKLVNSKQALNEEFECLKQKQDTLISSLQFLQNDFDVVSRDKEALKESEKKLKIDNQNILRDIQNITVNLQDADAQIEDKSQQLIALKNHVKMLTEKEMQSSIHYQKMEKENMDIKKELSALKISLDMFKAAKKAAENDKNEENNELVKTIANLKSDLAKLTDDNQCVVKKLNSLSCLHSEAKTELSNAIENSKVLSDDLIKQKELYSSSQEQLKEASQKIEQLKSESLALTSLHNEEKAEINECCDQKLSEYEAALTAAVEERNKFQNKISQLEALEYDTTESQTDMCFNDMKERLECAERRCKDLNSNLIEMKQENHDFILKVKDLTEEKQSLCEELEEKKLEFESLNKISKEFDAEKQVAQQLLTKCKELENENSLLSLKLEKQEDHIVEDDSSQGDINFEEKYKQALLEMQEKINLFTEKETSFALAIKSTENECDSLKNELCQHKEDYTKLNNLHTSLNNTVESLKSDLLSSIEEKEELQRSLEKDLELEKKVGLELKSKLDANLTECERLREQLKTNEVQLEEKCKDIQKFETNLVESENKLSCIQSDYLLKVKDCEAQSAELEKLRKSRDVLQKENEMLENKLAESVHQNSLLDDLKQKNDLLKKQAAAIEQKLKEKEMTCNQLDIKITDLNKELERYVNIQAQNETRLHDNQNMILDLQEQLAHVKESSTKNAAEEKSQVIVDLEQIIAQLRETNKQREVTLENLTLKLEQAEADINHNKQTYEQQLTDITSQYEELKGENSRLLEEKHDVEVVNEKLQTSTAAATLNEVESLNLKKKIECLVKERNDLNERMATLNQADSSGVKSQLENLQQTLHEKEAYSAKLKVIAVKAKKELDAAKQQIQEMIKEKSLLQTKATDLNNKLMESQALVMSGAQTLQVECDKLQDEIDLIKTDKSAVQKQLDDVTAELSAVREQNEDVNAKLLAALMDADRLKMEKVQVEGKMSSSKSHLAKIEKDNDVLTKEKNALRQELDAAKIQLSTISKKLDEKQDQLSSVQSSLALSDKQLKQHDLMSLEMAQYEATLCGLQTQVSDLEAIVSERDEKVNDLVKQISELNGDRKVVEELRLDAEERVTRSREALDSTREQVARLSEIEHEVKGQLDSVNEQLEFSQQQCEEFKLSLAAKSSECRQLEEKLSSIMKMNTKSVELMERKIKKSQDEVEKLVQERDAIRSDYDSYKIRAHSVLKQQKSKEPHNPVPPGEGAKLNAMKEQMSQLQIKVAELQNVILSRDQELDLLQGDYDRLLRQQQQSSEGALERETRWKSRLKSLQQELVAMRKQHDVVTSKLACHRDETAALIANAVQDCKSEQEAEMMSLHEELRRKSEELDSMRNELKRMEEPSSSTPTPRPSPMSPVVRPHVAPEPGLDYRSMARESGEGEEQPDEESVMSFERILQTPRIHSVVEMSESASVTSEIQIKQLETRIVVQTKQLEHSTEVARESEETALRLADQNKVLKEEIRRLEKNQERDKSVSNMEYLKNVVYKFLTLPPCDERRHLVPVLDTMLRLSGEEKRVVETLANGEEGETDRSSGWGSYLQRWSGMQ